MRRNEEHGLQNLKELTQTLRSHLRVQKLLNVGPSSSVGGGSVGLRRRVRGRRARMMRRAAEKQEHSPKPDKKAQQEEELMSKMLDQFVRTPLSNPTGTLSRQISPDSVDFPPFFLEY